MAKRPAKTAKPTVALEFRAISTPRITPITLEPAIHFPLPAGQNPGDPYYRKVQLNPYDPSDHAVIATTLDRSAFVTDDVAFILHWADWAIEASPAPSTRTFIERSRTMFAQATAMLDTIDMSAGTRLMLKTAIRKAFEIGELKGELRQALHARADMPRARGETVREGRAKATQAAEARRKREQEIIETNKWSLEGDGLADRLRKALAAGDAAEARAKPDDKDAAKRARKPVSLSTIRGDLEILRRAITW